MTLPITITVGIPDRCLSPNSRAHWGQKARAAKKARSDAYMCACEALPGSGYKYAPGWKRATVDIVFYWPTKHAHDADNSISMLKSALDGITDAGIIEDDRGLTIGRVLHFADKHNPRVELTFTPTETTP